jgi:large subunit ribosomal protein L17
MRHRKKGKKLGRNTKQRQALFKSLIRALILKEEIKTTQAKAKAVKGLIDKLITRAKTSSLASRRQVLAFLGDKKAVHKLFDVIVARSKARTSGFTRFVRLGRRRGDNTMMVKLEFVDKPVVADKPQTSSPAKTKTARKPAKKSQQKSNKKAKQNQ